MKPIYATTILTPTGRCPRLGKLAMRKFQDRPTSELVFGDRGLSEVGPRIEKTTP